MKRRRRMTMLELAVRRTGSFRKGRSVAEFVLWWHLVAADLGRDDFTMDEQAERSGVSRSQTFRQQSEFREAFGLNNPGELNNAGLRQWAKNITDLGKLAASDVAMGVFVEVEALA